ncbi:GntR family transcriptional regulator [Streptomyces sp. NPDC046805]|uniref:FadR/GntR family transcriptional regulator n=1 Tax=Streptomyces sp. NPDC046805 TaxID=3155134 RepID=UPI00340F13F6
MNPEGVALRGRQKARLSHHDVADELRARISSGVLGPGQRMPTQSALCAEFRVERGVVRQALRILQDEQLLTNVSKGSPATVAPPRPAPSFDPSATPQATVVSLTPRITEAFSAEHVTIDAMCLRATQLALAIGEPLRRIHTGQLKPAKIDVRVLLPSREIELAFPAPVDSAAAKRLHRQWLTQRNAQCQVLRYNLRTLRSSHGIETQVSFRALPFTPPVKLYLLNGTEALFAYYTLTRQAVELDEGESVEAYDPDGLRSTLFGFRTGGGPRAEAFVQQSSLSFDSLWETISSRLVLPD